MTSVFLYYIRDGVQGACVADLEAFGGRSYGIKMHFVLSATYALSKRSLCLYGHFETVFYIACSISRSLRSFAIYIS